MNWIVPTIDYNTHCPCGYNLRGLTYDHACPERGRHALNPLRFYIGFPYEAGTDHGDQVMRTKRALDDASDASGFSLEACWLVRCAATYAMRYGGYQEPIPANVLCQALREYARLHYGGMSQAIMHLGVLGISRSEDVGRIVHALVLAGLLQNPPADAGGDFHGMFTLATFEAVRLL